MSEVALKPRRKTEGESVATDGRDGLPPLPAGPVSFDGRGVAAELPLTNGLFFVVAVLAAVLRLTNLGKFPLSAAEAQEALASWQVWQAQPMTNVAPGSPAYFSLTTLLTPILGDSDGVMRLVPAVLGVGLVLLPWLWRNRLGKTGAVVTSVLLAVSPTLGMAARAAGGSSLALFATLLGVIAFFQYRESGRRQWLFALSGAVALGLASAPLVYGAAVALAVAWAVSRWLGPNDEGPRTNDQIPDALSLVSGRWSLVFGQKEARLALFIGSITFLGLATLFLLYPAGLGAAAMLPVKWLRHFSLNADALTWGTPFLALVRYELPLVLLGAAAIVWAAWHGRPLPAFLTYWLSAIFLLAFLQPGSLDNVLLMTLPGYLLIGFYADEVLTRAAGGQKWPLAAVLLFLGGVLLVNLARYSRIALQTPSLPSYAVFVALALAVAVLSISYARTWDKDAAHQGSLVGLLVLLVVYNWGTAWWLAHRAADDPRERWVTTAADPDTRRLQQKIEELSYQGRQGIDGVSIFSAVQDPALQWTLRDFPAAQYGRALPPGVQSDVVITGAESAAEPGENYLGMDFVLNRSEAPPATTPQVLDVLRWWLLRQTNATYQQERVILWVRTDLVQSDE